MINNKKKKNNAGTLTREEDQGWADERNENTSQQKTAERED
jgi:hypothetical protein